MSTRDPRRQPRPAPPPNEAADTPVAGLSLDAKAATRSGNDARRRGWFWHWNSIVTQYAPLLGLKGVGLLNSYTVWTDRREESPHRGYAFPSQQSEADFYGEDRAELITINKILVALDLIEIRKEMVLRADSQGRRWRVPHNFYRVKDHDDGFGLTSRDVLKVADLADRDKGVYRYVRRVFSPRFSPIDGDNVWHRMLPELRQTEVWQRLAERTAREEDRASARTRAGHAARRGADSKPAPARISAPTTGDAATMGDAPNDSGSDSTGTPGETSVAPINRGLDLDVALVNDGSTPDRSTAVDECNRPDPTVVGPANTTYDQSNLTTTTRDLTEVVQLAPDPAVGLEQTPVAPGSEPPPDRAVVAMGSGPAHGPGGGPAPDDGPGEEAAIRAFGEANDRLVTPAERKLLAGLAERFEPVAVAAHAVDPTTPESGWAWVAAAIYEAVEAGSAFVAPRRVREILSRWEREGVRSQKSNADGGRGVGRRRASSTDPGLGELPDIRLPHGHGSRRTWAFVVGLLGEALGQETLTELVAGSAIARYQDGEVTIAVPDPDRAERFATTYRDLVARKLSEAMRRPVRIAVLTGDDETVADDVPPPARSRELESTGDLDKPTDEAAIVISSFRVDECGMPSGQVWSAVLSELAARPEVSRANFDAWLRSTVLLGRKSGGEPGTPLIVGVPHDLARRRVSTRFVPALRTAIAAVVGVAISVEIVVTREWLATDAAVDASTVRRKDSA